MVYTAEHLSLAMIEYLAHLDTSCPPRDLMLARAEVPEGVSRITLRAERLPTGWRSFPAPESFTEYGEHFVREQKAAILIVPSAIAVTTAIGSSIPPIPTSQRSDCTLQHPSSTIHACSKNSPLGMSGAAVICRVIFDKSAA